MRKTTSFFPLFVIGILITLALISCGRKNIDTVDPTTKSSSSPVPTPAEMVTDTKIQFEEKLAVAPTPEPLPPVTDLCGRMRNFDDVDGDVREMDQSERREYWRGRNAMVSALEYHIRQNPYRKSLGCNKNYSINFDAEPSTYLEGYMNIIPRSLMIRIVKPEMADDLKVLRASSTFVDLRTARSEIQKVRDTLMLTKQDLIALGVTQREILEAEIDFSDPNER